MQLGIETGYAWSGLGQDLLLFLLKKVLTNKLDVFGSQLSRGSVCMMVSCPGSQFAAVSGLAVRLGWSVVVYRAILCVVIICCCCKMILKDLCCTIKFSITSFNQVMERFLNFNIFY